MAPFYNNYQKPSVFWFLRSKGVFVNSTPPLVVKLHHNKNDLLQLYFGGQKCRPALVWSPPAKSLAEADLRSSVKDHNKLRNCGAMFMEVCCNEIFKNFNLHLLKKWKRTSQFFALI